MPLPETIALQVEQMAASCGPSEKNRPIDHDEITASAARRTAGERRLGRSGARP
jgi:hypothetical protein